MKQIIVTIVMALLLAMSSCKSHKQTVVRQPQRVAKETVKIPKGASGDPTYAVDVKVGSALVNEAKRWLGTPYRYGGECRSGADCSGMLMVIYRDVAGLKLPRNSAAQCEYCFGIDKRHLSPGDLVFFSTSKGKGKVSHVGMYIGSGKMIHASSSRGVIISDLDEKYYVNHYHSSGRVYGITYAATGNKQKEYKDYGKVLLADNANSGNKKSDKNKKSKAPVNPAKEDVKHVEPSPVVHEMSLDDFVAMQQARARVDSVKPVEDVIEPRDSVVVEPVVVAEPIDTVKTEVCDSITAETPQVKAPTVIVNGRRVEVQPVEQPHKQQPDSVPSDSARQAVEIRETVVKAMKFGK